LALELELEPPLVWEEPLLLPVLESPPAVPFLASEREASIWPQVRLVVLVRLPSRRRCPN
jgi:hypothetical protein